MEETEKIMNDFEVGDLVLCEWEDEKLYYAYVEALSHETKSCIVMFEDLQYYNVPVEHVHSGK